MTRLETQVLDLLREDCRLPLEKLAVMLGVSTEEVAETIDSLERRRVILHYAPTINWDLTDRERGSDDSGQRDAAARHGL